MNTMTNPNEVTYTDVAIKRLYDLIGSRLVMHEWEAIKRELSLMESRTSATSDAADAARYRRLRENWIECKELKFHGRLAAIDAAIDAAISAGGGL